MNESNDSQKRSKPFNWGKEVRVGGNQHQTPESLQGVERRGNIEGDSENSQANWEGENKPSPDSNILTLTLAIVFLSLFLGSGLYLLKGTPSERADPDPSLSSVNSHKSISIPDSTLYDIPPIKVAKKFALTTDVEERLKWTRNPEEIRKRLSQYPQGAREVLAHKITPQGDISIEDAHYTSFLAELENGERRLLCVVGTTAGPRVDWDAYARYGTASWDDILSGKVSLATVRIFPELSTHYLRNFRDEEKWLAFALGSPDLEIPLYGYLDKESELYQKVKPLLSSRIRRAVVDIKISREDIPHRQVEITGLRTLGWVEP